MPDTSTTIFFAGLAVTIFVARYFINTSGDAGNGSSRSGPRAEPRQVTEDMISVVSVLVPHTDRETIRRDLEQTHSVERTSERLLAKSKESADKKSSLIDKYSAEDATSTENAGAESAGWIDDRKQREERFKRQRQQMVLKARQRTLELEQAKQG